MIQWNVSTPWTWCMSLHPKPLKASRWGKGRDLTNHLYRYANDRTSDKVKNWQKFTSDWQSRRSPASTFLKYSQRSRRCHDYVIPSVACMIVNVLLLLWFPVFGEETGLRHLVVWLLADHGGLLPAVRGSPVWKVRRGGGGSIFIQQI